MHPYQPETIQAVQQTEDTPMLSNATILILSGVLIGIAISEPLGELSCYVFAGGLSGLLAYLIFMLREARLDTTSQLRYQEAIEARLHRHLLPQRPVPTAELNEQHRLLEWLNQETKALTN